MVGVIGAHGAAGAGDPIPAPHPQITEVLFNVPPGSDGDANKDGARHAAGDEFIEVANAHSAPINLKGYVLHSRRASFAGGTGKGVRFEFPDAELQPHATAVVFNGCDARFAGPMGSEAGAAKEANTDFGSALAFDMGVTAQGNAFANGGDWVALIAPDGTIVDCVWWGEPEPAAPEGALRIQKVDANPKGSVQRLSPEGAMEAHRGIDGKACSPGRIPSRTRGTTVKPK